MIELFSLKMCSLLGLAIIAGVIQGGASNRVYELSDRFLDIYQEGTWLVKFYAPWCGHCKKLEPVWMQVAQHLAQSDVRVGRVDCTKYTSVASHFGIRGYPTIMFIRGSEFEDTYEGDRERDHIVEYAHRMAAPTVTSLPDAASVRQLSSRHLLYFLYAGERLGPLWEAYSAMAGRFRAHHYFYSCTADVFSKQVKDSASPAVSVWKDGRFHLYQPEDAVHVNESLYQFVNTERFTRFMKITTGNFGQLLHTGKLIAIAVTEENPIKRITADQEKFRAMLEKVAIDTADKYSRRELQFGWVGQPSLVNGVAARTLEVPSLIVVNASDYTHFVPDDEPAQLTEAAVALFLEDVFAGRVQGGGGDTYPMRVFRALYQARSSVEGMWRGNPILTALLFGLPAGFLSLICYSICCQDIMDAEDEDEDFAYHEKHE
ncbi:protein disulfide-isomerase TMX3-like [Pollicipes pollicipes]|uniref:protein disulfide-isomerase TMX3-like n=1 Tax=Pollicipes pollicipes TaxID=41117 RepID=UPI0018855B6B|nr:protein disulfide-isomerase TMX3-like [Pollicipes pollicipes]XP_037078313.1 protein disulfide-isomerase TMX3-like [Pollicipes pollicipes]